jgi:hypothetical protein
VSVVKAGMKVVGRPGPPPPTDLDDGEPAELAPLVKKVS